MDVHHVLVTGGLGFIGSAISERFLNSGVQVTIVDSLVSNVVDQRHFTSRYPLARVEPMSVADYFSDRSRDASYGLVIHAASLVGPASILSYAGTIGEAIVHSTSKIVDFCTARRVPLISFSSAEVYGISGVLSESMDIRVPHAYNARLEYALGKLTSESMIVNSRRRGLRATIIRPFNVAGPCQRRSGGFVMPTFVQQALSGKPITVFETGGQKRAFTDVSDVVEFVVNYAACGFDRPDPTFNVGNPDNGATIIDLAQRIKAILGSNSDIVFTNGKDVYGPDYCEAESYEKVPDISRARVLGWEPIVSLDDIIINTAQFFCDQRSPRDADVRRRTA
jgi:nucleoside-diphosphate-sugar epimerase